MFLDYNSGRSPDFRILRLPVFTVAFLQKLLLRFTVAGTVREFHPVPFSFQNTGNQNFCKDSFLYVFAKKHAYTVKNAVVLKNK